MAVHHLYDTCISAIQVNQVVRYLAIVFSESPTERITEFFTKITKDNKYFSQDLLGQKEYHRQAFS